MDPFLFLIYLYFIFTPSIPRHLFPMLCALLLLGVWPGEALLPRCKRTYVANRPDSWEDNFFRKSEDFPNHCPRDEVWIKSSWMDYFHDCDVVVVFSVLFQWLLANVPLVVRPQSLPFGCHLLIYPIALSILLDRTVRISPLLAIGPPSKRFSLRPDEAFEGAIFLNFSQIYTNGITSSKTYYIFLFASLNVPSCPCQPPTS